jgi:outer membrane receptor for ferrienterochelin and colicins
MARLFAASLAIALLVCRPAGAQQNPVQESQPRARTEPETPAGAQDHKETTGATAAEEQLYETEDVVVTGTRTEKRLTQAPVKTDVVSRELIDLKQAVSLADALEMTTGVRVENDCQNCGFNQVRLNGLEGPFTQILIDGRPIVSTLAGVYGLEQIPEEMIERIEVVKGGGSALYGPNAIGGVINVITKRPFSNVATFTLRQGWIGDKPDSTVSAQAGVTNEAKDMALRVFGSLQRRQPWDANDDGFSEVGKIRRASAGSEAYWDIVENGALALKFHILQEDRRGGDRFGVPEHDAGIAESIQTRRFGGELSWKHAPSAMFDYQLAYALAYTERNSYYGGGGDVQLPELPANRADLTDDQYAEFLEAWEAKQLALGAYGRTKNPMHNAEALANLNLDTLGGMVITGGVQFVSDGLDDKTPGYDVQLKDTYWDLGAFLQHDWNFASWGESVIGLRVDKHSELDAPLLSPRAALLLKPTDWLRTRTAFSTGFRAPQVFDEDLHITVVGGEGAVISNADDLKAEFSYGGSQQIEFINLLAKPWGLTISLNGFVNVLTDAFSVEENDDPSTSGTLEFTRFNRGTTTVYGGEIDINLNYRDTWLLSTGWTLESATNDEEDGDFGSKEIFRTPPFYGYLMTLLKPIAGLELSGSVDVTSPMKVPHYAGFIDEDRLDESPWFAVVDASVAYKIDVDNRYYLKPFVSLNNMLDSYQSDFDRGPDRDAGYIYGPRFARTVYAGLKGGF